MRIISLELKGYRWLALNNIDYIKITPESKIQLILGTNGSGKSSLLKELTPLPASKHEYRSGGYKVIEISHRNNHYVLKSIFHANGAKYHFIENDIDLMSESGGNSSLYKDLVKQKFGITVDIHKLMLGGNKTRFTELDVSKRRGWMTRFSDADYTYAFSYYKKLKDQYNALTGAVKIQQTRLVQEMEKLLKPEEEAKYREDIRVLNEVLFGFLEAKSPSNTSRDQVVREITDIDRQLESLTYTITKTRNMFLSAGEKFGSLSELDGAIVQTAADIQYFQKRSDEITQLMDQQHKTLDALRSSDMQSIEDVDKLTDQLLAQIAAAKQELRLNLTFDDSQTTYQTLVSISDDLISISGEIEDNADRRFSRDNYIALSQKFDLITGNLAGLVKQQGAYEIRRKELEHLKTHDQTECPKCKHTWNKGYSESEHRKIEIEIQNASVIHQNLTGELNATKEQLDKAKAYQDLYRSYITITRAAPNLQPFWQHLAEQETLFQNPRQVNQLIQTLKSDLLVQTRADELNKRLKENLELKLLLSRNQQVNLAKLIEESNKSDKELYSATVGLQKAKARKDSLQSMREWHNRVKDSSDTIDLILGQRDRLKESLYKQFEREYLNECIQLTQRELATREQAISKIDIQKALIADIEKQITEMTAKAEVLMMAIRELSPSEGLIARGLTGFINHFISQVNSFIKKAWLYPLELIPIEPTENEDLDLDYKFQVRVNENDEDLVPDIADTSSGMKEIIDLAFRIVSMQYLDLQDAPLYLDEFARTMDPAHRRSALYVITNLLTTANFSQIYMISHYEDSYGSLANTDITILDERNMDLAQGTVFNKNCIIR